MLAGATATTATAAGRTSPRALFAVADQVMAKMMDSVISDAIAAAIVPVVLAIILRTLIYLSCSMALASVGRDRGRLGR